MSLSPPTLARVRPQGPDGLARLLRELGPRLRRGGPAPEPPGYLACGVPELDALLAGGFPRGRLSELCGGASSGRTSLALALLARATRAGELCAVVDAADGLDPQAAEAAGVLLDRVLWARAPGMRPALRAAECLLETGGFALVLFDRSAEGLEAPASAWTRLARAARAGRAALLLLSLARAAGSVAEVALALHAQRARFGGAQPLLEGLEIEAELLRHRSAPAGQRTRLQLHTRAA